LEDQLPEGEPFQIPFPCCPLPSVARREDTHATLQIPITDLAKHLVTEVRQGTFKLTRQIGTLLGQVQCLCATVAPIRTANHEIGVTTSDCRTFGINGSGR
jgi:hypothetical protein